MEALLRVELLLTLLIVLSRLLERFKSEVEVLFWKSLCCCIIASIRVLLVSFSAKISAFKPTIMELL